MGKDKSQNLSNRAKAVKKRLIDMNMTQRELADKIGVQETFLSNMLKGRKAGNVYWARIEQILGLSLKDIS